MARTKTLCPKYTKRMVRRGSRKEFLEENLQGGDWPTKRRRVFTRHGGMEKLRSVIMFGTKATATDLELEYKLEYLKQTTYKLQGCGGYHREYITEDQPRAAVDGGPERLISVSARDKEMLDSEKPDLHGYEVIARPRGVCTPALSDIRSWIEREYLKQGWVLGVSDADALHMFRIGATDILSRAHSDAKGITGEEPTIFAAAFNQVPLAAALYPDAGTISYNAHNNPSIFAQIDDSMELCKVLDRPCLRCAENKLRGQIHCGDCGRRLKRGCHDCGESKRRGLNFCARCGKGVGGLDRKERQPTEKLPGVCSLQFITNRTAARGLYAPPGQHWSCCEDVFRLVEEDRLGGKLAVFCPAMTKIMYRTKNDFPDNAEWEKNRRWLKVHRNYSLRSMRDTHASKGGPKVRGFHDETAYLFEEMTKA